MTTDFEGLNVEKIEVTGGASLYREVGEALCYGECWYGESLYFTGLFRVSKVGYITRYVGCLSACEDKPMYPADTKKAQQVLFPLAGDKFVVWARIEERANKADTAPRVEPPWKHEGLATSVELKLKRLEMTKQHGRKLVRVLKHLRKIEEDEGVLVGTLPLKVVSLLIGLDLVGMPATRDSVLRDLHKDDQKRFIRAGFNVAYEEIDTR
jgi:hypothetical protein